MHERIGAVLCISAFVNVRVHRRSEDTALFILKEIYDEPSPELVKLKP